MSQSEALSRLGEQEWQYFSLLPRKTKGRKKKDVVDAARLVWAEFDDEGEIDRFEIVGVSPTLVYSSGRRGYWAIWALDELQDTMEIENLGKAIAVLIRGDRAVAERSRLGRLPESLNHNSGQRGELVEFNRERVPWSAFEHITRLSQEEPSKWTPGTLGSETAIQFSDAVPLRPLLSERQNDYVNAHQTEARSSGGRFDRSSEEQAILVELFKQGRSRAEVATIASPDRSVTRSAGCSGDRVMSA